MVHLASSTSPVDLAWSAFDTAAIRLHRMYSRSDADAPEQRAARLELAQEVSKLWDEWRALFTADEPRPAA